MINNGPMRVGKVFVFTRELPVPAYLGPGFVYAVTLPQGHAPVFACAEIKGPDKSDAEAQRAAGERALADLTRRLPPDFEVLSFLVVDPVFGSLKMGGKSPLRVPHSPPPADFESAVRAVDAHLCARLEMLRLEFPHVPWDALEAAPHLEALKNYGHLGIYDVAHPQLAPTWAELTRRRKLLLHVCCGPDAGGVIALLKKDYDVVGFWYDPNIQPKDEHDKRLAAFEKVAAIEDIPVVVGEYDVERFMEQICGLEHTPERGAKCSGCYDLRLERAAVEAQRQGCDLYATTLAISPKKMQLKLKNFGLLNERKYGVPYLARNFVKHEGFNDSVDYSREHDIYRQDYCGCWFSLHEGGRGAQALARKLDLTPERLQENMALRRAQPDHGGLEAKFSALKAEGETTMGSKAYSPDPQRSHG